MKLWLAVACAVALTLAIFQPPARAGEIRGGMASTGGDTTFVFSPPLRSGVDLRNPDAAETVFLIYSGTVVKVAVLPPVSKDFFRGQVDSVTASPSTTQRVGVYGDL